MTPLRQLFEIVGLIFCAYWIFQFLWNRLTVSNILGQWWFRSKWLRALGTYGRALYRRITTGYYTHDRLKAEWVEKEIRVGFRRKAPRWDKVLSAKMLRHDVAKIKLKEDILKILCTGPQSSYYIWSNIGGQKRISLGKFYVTMIRLDKAGKVVAEYGEATPERGGNRPRIYTLVK